MDENVAKAVERVGFALRSLWEPQAEVHADYKTIRACLVEPDFPKRAATEEE